jgi:hypothetical protein
MNTKSPHISSSFGDLRPSPDGHGWVVVVLHLLHRVHRRRRLVEASGSFGSTRTPRAAVPGMVVVVAYSSAGVGRPVE